MSAPSTNARAFLMDKAVGAGGGGGGGNNEYSDDMQSNTQTVTRTICVHIEGSLNQLQHQGHLGGLWKGVSGRESVLFHPSLDDNMASKQNSSDVVNNLRAAVVKKVTLKEHRSTFPHILGVDINCIPASEVTNIGEKFAYTVLPQSYISTPQVIYQADARTIDNTEWQKRFGKWNHENLETEGIMDVPNQAFLFVHMDHPAIALLRFNQSLLGCNIDQMPKLEEEYYKVSKQVMSTCFQTIRDDVLSHMQTRDLNQFTLQLRRLNNTPWDELDHTAELGLELDPSLTDDAKTARKQHHIKEFLTKPYSYIARLEFEYEIPCNDTTGLA